MSGAGTGMRGGFSLMEVVISVGVIAIMVPIVMAFTVEGGKSSRVASEETRSSFVARSVAHEIARAREGEGQVISEVLPWPEFPAGGERVVFSVNGDGLLLARLEAGAYDSGVTGREVAYLVAVEGEAYELDGVSDAAVLSRVEISVETPPAAAAENRRKFVYVELMHADD